MKYLPIIILVLMHGCSTVSVEELQRQAEGCKDSLVQDEDGQVRSRTQKEVDRDCGKLYDQLAKRTAEPTQERKVSCPPGYVVVCTWGCGFIRSEDREYSCVDRKDLFRQYNVY